MTDYLKLAQDAYTSSTSYVDSNYRKKWEDSLAMFQSRHPSDSKYNSDAYKHRSKLFRPKSRSMVRKHEAAAAAAFFSNVDVISTDAVDQSNKEQVASAALWKEVLNYRLTKTIPWFQTVVGGVQDAMTVGVVCSYQYWKYSEKASNEYVTTGVDENGEPILEQAPPKVLEDEPCIELMPIENLRIDAAASWINPIKTSPYVIRLIPMYVVDVKTMMNKVDTKTNQPKWKKLDDGQIRTSMTNRFDTTKQAREGTRQDPNSQNNAPITDFEIVWAHENFMRIDGEEMVYYTMGTSFMLTEPKPLKEVYFHGERPIALGVSVIETHKIMPDSPVMLGENLQREANEIVNQRLDNVKLVLNKRYIVKRGAQVDLKSLVRNVPGSITVANDPIGDVKTIDFGDVTSSSYAEQDRVNVDYDELTGNFSQGSVMTNRKMGETVGGMNLISGSANQLTEYTIRTITETWIERVLVQLVKLEQAYETNETILAIAADRAKLVQKYGINEITDNLLNHELTLTVNVGMGATDPTHKLGKFIGAMKAYGEVAALQLPNVDMKEAGKEVFGLAGYRDGRRFMIDQDENDPENNPHLKQAVETMHAMEARIKELESGEMSKVAEASAKETESENKADIERYSLLMETASGIVIEAMKLPPEQQKGATVAAVSALNDFDDSGKLQEAVVALLDIAQGVQSSAQAIDVAAQGNVKKTQSVEELKEMIAQTQAAILAPRQMVAQYDENGMVVGGVSQVVQ